MTAITLTNHELLQLKLLLRDIELIQKMNSPFDNEAIEILSFKIIEHLNASQTLKDYHIVYTNEMVSSQTEISDEIFGQELFNYFTNQHNISLLQSEMHDIIDIVKKMEQAEISDEEIRKAAIEYANNVYDKNDFKDEWRGVLNDFIAATKWYREQLKKKQ